MNLLHKFMLVRRLKHHFYRWNREQIQSHQKHQLELLIALMKKGSPYYRELLTGMEAPALEELPLMDKSTMMDNFNRINTAGLSRDQLISFKISQEREGKWDLYDGSFSVGLSSGTSGNKVLTVLSKRERDLYSCLLWARHGLPRGVKGYRVLFAIRTNNPAYMEVGSFGIKLVYVDYTQTAEYLLELVNKNKLNILAGPPSLLALLAEHRENIKHPIDALICYAEVLNEETKKMLEQTFNAPVGQIYQGAEGFIASTCIHGRLHINEDALLVELQEAGDTLGNARKVLVTDLYRTTQPIIRYALGDIVELSNVSCPCGSHFRVIEKIHGRSDDIFFLEGPGGTTKHLFPDYVARSINQASPDILEFQALQHAPGEMEIRLVTREGSDRREIERAVLDNLGYWAKKVGGSLGRVSFNAHPPEKNPRSNKMIRVVRMY